LFGGYISNKKESVSSGFSNTKSIVENKIQKKGRICKGILLIFAKMSFTTKKKNGLMTTLKN